MRRRRRYEVVVVGVSGHAASQRSVISEHRSEADARESAELERARLEVIYGEGAGAWRILVLRDGETVAEERPAARPDEQALVPPAGAGEPAHEPAAGEPAHEPAGEAQAEEGGAPPPEREPWPDMDISGPVPEWVISRVEESIARRAERERRDDEDRGGTGEAP